MGYREADPRPGGQLIRRARELAELNRVEGWNGNDCDEAMRLLNTLADAYAASRWDSGVSGASGVSPELLWEPTDAPSRPSRHNCDECINSRTADGLCDVHGAVVIDRSAGGKR